MASKLEIEAIKAVIEGMSPSAQANLTAAAKQIESIGPIVREAAIRLSPLRGR